MIRLLVEKAVESIGFETITFDSATAALTHLEQNPLPDVIIADFRLPAMTGAQFVATLESSFGIAPVALLMTGTAESVTDKERRLFLKVLSKPFSMMGLLSAVKDAAARAARRSSHHRLSVDAIEAGITTDEDAKVS